MFVIRFIIKLWQILKDWHEKQTSSGIWYCKNNLCKCYNTVQKKFYIKPPKCPLCSKWMKVEVLK